MQVIISVWLALYSLVSTYRTHLLSKTDYSSRTSIYHKRRILILCWWHSVVFLSLALKVQNEPPQRSIAYQTAVTLKGGEITTVSVTSHSFLPRYSLDGIDDSISSKFTHLIAAGLGHGWAERQGHTNIARLTWWTAIKSPVRHLFVQEYHVHGCTNCLNSQRLAGVLCKLSLRPFGVWCCLLFYLPTSALDWCRDPSSLAETYPPDVCRIYLWVAVKRMASPNRVLNCEQQWACPGHLGYQSLARHNMI